MTTLIFNSNYLLIVLPPGETVSTHCRVGATFSLRCIYTAWRVSDLYQEWGIDDFPAETPIWVASFLALPGNQFRNTEADQYSPSIEAGELYWIALHPTGKPHDRIPVLCSADSDRLYFGVSTIEDEFISPPPLASGETLDGQAWLPVRIDRIDQIDLSEEDENEKIAHLVIYGKRLKEWTIAEVDPIH
jgi:hypothetical protein